jgi:hypothetical protein
MHPEPRSDTVADQARSNHPMHWVGLGAELMATWGVLLLSLAIIIMFATAWLNELGGPIASLGFLMALGPLVAIVTIGAVVPEHPAFWRAWLRWPGRAPAPDRLAVLSLLALAGAFAIIDAKIGASTMALPVLIVLALGFAAAWPLFLARGRGVRRLMISIALYAVFMGWVTGLRNIDWNSHKAFLRAYAQIQTGMTREEVEAVIHRELSGWQPVVDWSKGPGYLRLDDDSMIIMMVGGRVTDVYWSRGHLIIG